MEAAKEAGVNRVVYTSFLGAGDPHINSFEIADHKFTEKLILDSGLGWNFMFVGGTTLLTTAYAPEERVRVQATHDFIVFGGVACTAGWRGDAASRRGDWPGGRHAGRHTRCLTTAPRLPRKEASIPESVSYAAGRSASSSGASFTRVSGCMPFSSAAEYRKGLNDEPGCRFA